MYDMFHVKITFTVRTLQSNIDQNGFTLSWWLAFNFQCWLWERKILKISYYSFVHCQSWLAYDTYELTDVKLLTMSILFFSFFFSSSSPEIPLQNNNKFSDNFFFKILLYYKTK